MRNEWWGEKKGIGNKRLLITESVKEGSGVIPP
jgi:hypothetical protein